MSSEFRRQFNSVFFFRDMLRAKPRSLSLFLFLFLILPGLPLWSENTVIVPKVGGNGQRAGAYSFRVDRKEDHQGKSPKETARRGKLRSFAGTVLEPEDEFGHLKLKQDRGRTLYLLPAADCRIRRDRMISEEELEEGTELAVIGDVRGYARPRKEDEERRRILGVRFILTGEPPARQEEKTTRRSSRAAPIPGKLVALGPLLMRTASGELYELRPGRTSRVLAIEQGSLEDIKEGTKLRGTGIRRRVTLRPKGKTLTRYIYETQELNLLAPELRATEYKQVFEALGRK